jgi:sarcosine oxidase subunit beta
VWGYAHAVDQRGIHIHPLTEVTGITVENEAVTGVQTNRGFIKTGMVLNATAGWCSTISEMVGVKLPITTFPLQACVSEPLKPFLDVIIVSGSLHIYVSQTDRGELVMGAAVDPFVSYSMHGSLAFLEEIAGHMLELFPSLANVRILRQWAGLCDMTPDYSPVMGVTPVKGFLVDVGWGTYGFKASPIAGSMMAQLIASGETPDLIAPFRLARFAENDLVGEKGAASVGH